MSHTDSKHLVIIAHGSRRAESNNHFTALAESLAQSLDDNYTAVHACFLELTTPTLMGAIETAIDQGATAVDVFPYFLGPGSHVLKDIPALLDQAQSQFIQCKFKQLEFFGATSSMANLMASSILTQQAQD